MAPKPAPQNWLDRAIGVVSPERGLRRMQARAAASLMLRHYEGASAGRRTQGWNRASGDANTVQGGVTLSRLREVARDLVRNNPYAESALATICDHTIGWGIVAKPATPSPRFAARWKQWAETTACDADGRHDLYGLQKLVLSAVVESGEVIVRRRVRRVSDGLPLPLQLQVIEPDLLDSSKTHPLANGGQVLQGVEFDALGKRVAYWLYPSHPGASLGASRTTFGGARRIPADEILHVFKSKRPGQVRAVSWFAPVVLRFKDFDEFEDATLMKQKIAACLAVITTDINGDSAPLGVASDGPTSTSPEIDTLEPGAILNIPAGRDVEVVQPPSVREYNDYCGITLRAIATGLGVTYEDLTGDYTDLPFSAARMSRLRHQARVIDWQFRLMIPQFCDPVWVWAAQAAELVGALDAAVAPAARWSTPAMPMVDPANEGLAYQRNIRTGIQSLSEAIRERGYDPDELFAEMAADNTKLDDLGLVLDSDPRKMSQAGQLQSTGGSAAATRSAGGGWQSRFADFFARLPEDKADEILVRMFGAAVADDAPRGGRA